MIPGAAPLFITIRASAPGTITISIRSVEPDSPVAPVTRQRSTTSNRRICRRRLASQARGVPGTNDTETCGALRRRLLRLRRARKRRAQPEDRPSCSSRRRAMRVAGLLPRSLGRGPVKPSSTVRSRPDALLASGYGLGHHLLHLIRGAALKWRQITPADRCRENKRPSVYTDALRMVLRRRTITGVVALPSRNALAIEEFGAKPRRALQHWRSVFWDAFLSSRERPSRDQSPSPFPMRLTID